MCLETILLLAKHLLSEHAMQAVRKKHSNCPTLTAAQQTNQHKKGSKKDRKKQGVNKMKRENKEPSHHHNKQVAHASPERTSQPLEKMKSHCQSTMLTQSSMLFSRVPNDGLLSCHIQLLQEDGGPMPTSLTMLHDVALCLLLSSQLDRTHIFTLQL